MDKLCDPVSTIQNKLNVPRRQKLPGTLCPLQNKMVFKICLWQIEISNSKYQNIYRGDQN